MSLPYTLLDLLDQLPAIPKASIISRTIYSDEQIKAVLFGFAAGQELSEHTAATPAIIHILKGVARLTLGQETADVGEGAWAHLPAQLPHSVLAKTPLTMLLLLLKA
jgi:quercetin dioxygenase-like cupin family protein